LNQSEIQLASFCWSSSLLLSGLAPPAPQDRCPKFPCASVCVSRSLGRARYFFSKPRTNSRSLSSCYSIVPNRRRCCTVLEMPYVMKTEPPLPLRNGTQVVPRDRYPELGTWSGLAIDVRFVLQPFSILFFALSLSRSFVFFWILFYILTHAIAPSTFLFS
jgi:hypothetical protein